MELYYGWYEKSSLDIEPSDTDEYYAMEEAFGRQYVKVDGQLYAFGAVDDDISIVGFSIIIKPSEQHRFMAYFYNGGAELREVLENLIRNDLNK